MKLGRFICAGLAVVAMTFSLPNHELPAQENQPQENQPHENQPHENQPQENQPQENTLRHDQSPEQVAQRQGATVSTTKARRVAVLNASSRLVDLTHPFDATTIYWPTAEPFRLEVEKYGMTEKGYFYAAKRYAASEHGGTHLDAPIHFSEGGNEVAQIALDRFVGEGVVIDVTEACAQDPDYMVTIEDLRSWEVEHDRQLVDVIVLLRTGYGAHWRDRKKYLGTDRQGPEAVAELSFPGLDPDAAKWIAEHRGVKAIGIDTASIDRGRSERFQSHVHLFAHGIPVFENVADLHQLPDEGAMVIALPMKIGAGTGAPLRIIAGLPE